jgi:hypothetical protein
MKIIQLADEASSATVDIPAGSMRGMQTTIGPANLNLDDACYFLNENRTDQYEQIRQTLNAIADGGISLRLSADGQIQVEVNAPTQESLDIPERGEWDLISPGP